MALPQYSTQKTVLAVEKDGRLSYCRALPENRGKRNCPHLFHAHLNESHISFMRRMERQEEVALKRNFRYAKTLYEKERNRMFKAKDAEFSKGQLFEDEFCEKFVTSGTHGVTVRKADIVEDLFEGTDLWMDEVRVDVTMNEQKQGTIKFYGKEELKDVTVHFGIRTDNGQYELPEPVVVLYFETRIEINKRQAGNIPKNFCSAEVQAIVNGVFDTYYGYMDENGG